MRAERLLAEGDALYRQHDLSGAAARYREVIRLRPDLGAAHCNLAVTLRGMGEIEAAERSAERAVKTAPASADAHNIHGLVLRDRGLLKLAEECFRRAIDCNPLAPEGYANLGAVAGDQGRFQDAVKHFTKAVELLPSHPMLRYNLGSALAGLNALDAAAAEMEAALQIDGRFGPAHLWLARWHLAAGRSARAIEHATKAVQADQASADALLVLGVALRNAGRGRDAVDALARVIELQPDRAAGYVEIATAFQLVGDIAAAVDACRRGLACATPTVSLWQSLASNLGELGRIQDALEAVRKALEIDPNDPVSYSMYLFLLNYSDAHTPDEIFEEHRRWAVRHAGPLSGRQSAWPGRPASGRPLRIGFVSPDFRQHPIAFFLGPVLAHLDDAAFTVFCYSDVRHADAVTSALRRQADFWRDIAGKSDEDVAALVYSDRIDILVDLAVHSADNRLLVFARKPAPVQVTWLGYAGTTGLAEMDFKLTDSILDPPGMTERFHSEKLVRLPEGYWCYTPPSTSPDVDPAPALDSGRVTFGAFQNLAKLSPTCIALWASVLLAVPRSELAIKARGLGSEKVRSALGEAFAKHGIARSRLRMDDWTPLPEYLASFNAVDIVLDTFPFNGGTTSCHALWMGVPVVSYAGVSALQRMGKSLLFNIGLDNLAADSKRQFVEIAANLAGDLDELNRLRLSLRERVQQAPLTDSARFARGWANALDGMWRGRY